MLVALVFVSAGVIGWAALRAIAEWQRSSTRIAARRADAAVDLLFAGLVHDMRGAQRAVQSPLDGDLFAGAAPADRRNLAAGLLTRYEYPEAFFAWRGVPAPKSIVFFTRRDRPPAWLEPSRDHHEPPIILGQAPGVSAQLLARINQDARLGRLFSAFELQLLGEPYQVVATLSRSEGVHSPNSVFGFLVNLNWARHSYFPSVVSQIARVTDAGITLTVNDADGTAVVAPRQETLDAPTKERSFPLLFFDPALVASNPPADLDRTPWTARASAFPGSTVITVSRFARRTASVMVLSGLVLAVGLGLTLRASRMKTRLAEMRTDFVSSVSHELKTPIATLRAISENLAAGRAANTELTREFGRIGVLETQRLSRLVDNLLAYARITDVTEAYSFEPQSIAEIVDESLRGFTIALTQGDFDLHVDIPSDTPPVRADRLALELAVSNVIDNAIRYSRDAKAIAITAQPQGDSVVLKVADRGVGIPPEELSRVTRRFYRVPGSAPNGTGNGLGLAIVERIMADHGGTLRIESEIGAGTTVTLQLPAVDPGATARS